MDLSILEITMNPSLIIFHLTFPIHNKIFHFSLIILTTRPQNFTNTNLFPLKKFSSYFCSFSFGISPMTMGYPIYNKTKIFIFIHIIYCTFTGLFLILKLSIVDRTIRICNICIRVEF